MQKLDDSSRNVSREKYKYLLQKWWRRRDISLDNCISLTLSAKSNVETVFYIFNRAGSNAESSFFNAIRANSN